MNTTEKSIRKVLIAPLGWGLGHATRIIPIIQELQLRNIEPIPAAYGSAYELLRKEFPNLQIVRLPGFSFNYPKGNLAWLKVISVFPKFVFFTIAEFFSLKKIVKNFNIDAVISDGRYGLRNRRIHSIFITHQLVIKLPKYLSFLEYPLFLTNKFFLSFFNSVWIPDSEGTINLSGDLSHKYNLTSKHFFIGCLSRFNAPAESEPTQKTDLLVIISGLENQRTVFEKLILSQITKCVNKNVVVLLGKPGEFTEERIAENILVYSHLESNRFFDLICSADIIISRPGYSTVMDLSILGKKAIFIPTPGQTEQEYLAKYMQEMRYAPYYKQSEFDLEKALKSVENYTGIPRLEKQNLLQKTLGSLLNKEVR